MCDLFLNLYICIDDGRCMADKIGNDYPHKWGKKCTIFQVVRINFDKASRRSAHFLFAID